MMPQGDENQNHRHQLANHQRRHGSQMHEAPNESARFAGAHAQADQRGDDIESLQENKNT